MEIDHMPKLSVIVPVYNTEKYLRECIDSILAQTFTDFELILVDDGSTDGSGAICDEYAAKHPRIQVIHQENGGVTRARKAAMRIAAGSWISFIDSDDWIDPAMFATMLEKASTSASQIVICDGVIEYANQSKVAESLADEGIYDKVAMVQKIYPNMIMDTKMRCPGIAGWLCNKLFDKKILETVFWSIDDSYVYSEDALCSYATLLECEKLYILHMPLYHYRQHAASAVHQYNGTKRYNKALYAYYAYNVMLQNRGFDITEQINTYISVNSVDIIRKVLLFDTDNSLFRRINQARQFASNKIVQAALTASIQKFSTRSNRWKMLLVLKRCIAVLYILLRVRYCTLENKE
jgi:glycosyltransferase involved in cell wall biosynthesis